MDLSFFKERWKAVFLPALVSGLMTGFPIGSPASSNEILVNVEGQWVPITEANSYTSGAFNGLDRLPTGAPTARIRPELNKDYGTSLKNWIAYVSQLSPEIGNEILDTARKTQFIYVDRPLMQTNAVKVSAPIDYKEYKQATFRKYQDSRRIVYVSVPIMEDTGSIGDNRLSKKENQGLALLNGLGYEFVSKAVINLYLDRSTDSDAFYTDFISGWPKLSYLLGCSSYSNTDLYKKIEIAKKVSDSAFDRNAIGLSEIRLHQLEQIQKVLNGSMKIEDFADDVGTPTPYYSIDGLFISTQLSKIAAKEIIAHFKNLGKPIQFNKICDYSYSETENEKKYIPLYTHQSPEMRNCVSLSDLILPQSVIEKLVNNGRATDDALKAIALGTRSQFDWNIKTALRDLCKKKVGPKLDCDTAIVPVGLDVERSDANHIRAAESFDLGEHFPSTPLLRYNSNDKKTNTGSFYFVNPYSWKLIELNIDRDQKHRKWKITSFQVDTSLNRITEYSNGINLVEKPHDSDNYLLLKGTKNLLFFQNNSRDILKQ